MSRGYEILSLDELEAVPYHAREGERLLAVERVLGFSAAGINGWRGDPGETLVPVHREDSDEELYVVVRGRATFTVDEVTLDAPAGTLVHVPAGEERTAVAEEQGTIVLAIGGTPGEAHAPSGWTDWVVADALRRDGRVEEGRQAIRQMLERHGRFWGAPYNAACYEVLAGDNGAAIEYLLEAKRMDAASVRELAAEDSDLDALRDDPRFAEVLA
jgi:quercetin dioxygenase-like cupin family protein